MQQEPVAWWILVSVITAATITIGTFLKITYNDLKEAVASLREILTQIRETLSSQEEKNKNFDYLWIEVRKLQDEIKNLEKEINEQKNRCALCQSTLHNS